MFCTLKWVESDEAINAFSALSDNEILQELDKLGVQRAMIDTGAGKSLGPVQDNTLLSNKVPSQITIKVAVGQNAIHGDSQGNLAMYVLGSSNTQSHELGAFGGPFNPVFNTVSGLNCRLLSPHDMMCDNFDLHLVRHGFSGFVNPMTGVRIPVYRITSTRAWWLFYIAGKDKQNAVTISKQAEPLIRQLQLQHANAVYTSVCDITIPVLYAQHYGAILNCTGCDYSGVDLNETCAMFTETELHRIADDESFQFPGNKARVLGPAGRKLLLKQLHCRFGHQGHHPDCHICNTVKKSTRRIARDPEPVRASPTGFGFGMDAFTFSVPNIDGERHAYIMGAIDNSYMEEMCLAFKSDVPRFLIPIISDIRGQFQNDHSGHTIFSEIHVDGAGELNSADLREQLKELKGGPCTIVDTDPQRKESAAGQEARVKNAELAVKSMMLETSMPANEWLVVLKSFIWLSRRLARKKDVRSRDGDAPRALTVMSRNRISTATLDHELKSYPGAPGTICALTNTKIIGSDIAHAARIKIGVFMKMRGGMPYFRLPQAGNCWAHTKDFKVMPLSNGVCYRDYFNLPQTAPKVSLPLPDLGNQVEEQGARIERELQQLRSDPAAFKGRDVYQRWIEDHVDYGVVHGTVRDIDEDRESGAVLWGIDWDDGTKSDYTLQDMQNYCVSNKDGARVAPPLVTATEPEPEPTGPDHEPQTTMADVLHRLERLGVEYFNCNADSTWIQVCTAAGVPKNQRKLYYQYLSEQHGYGHVPPVLESETTENIPWFKFDDPTVKKGIKFLKGTPFPYPCGGAWDKLANPPEGITQAEYHLVNEAIVNVMATIKFESWLEAERNNTESINAMSAMQGGLPKLEVDLGECLKLLTPEGMKTWAHLPDPKTYAEAMSRPDAELWKQAFNKEHEAFHRLKVMEHGHTIESARAAGATTRPVPMKHILCIKRDPLGNYQKHKVRLVICGHRGFMIPGKHFQETWAATPDVETSRMIQVIALLYDWKRRSWDVDTAYLQSDEEFCTAIAMLYPTGWQMNALKGETLVGLLKANLYGHPEAARNWMRTVFGWLQKHFNTNGWQAKQSNTDPALWILLTPEGRLVLLVIWSDDNDAVAERDEDLDYVEQAFKQRFGVTSADPNFMLGVSRSITVGDDGVRVLEYTMPTYIENVYDEYKDYISDLKLRSTRILPLDEGFTLGPKEPQHTPDLAEQSKYRKMGYLRLMGSVNWAVRQCHLELGFHCSILASVMSTPSAVAWNAALKVLHWLYHNRDTGLCYRSDGNNEPIFYYDSSFIQFADSKAQYCVVGQLADGPITYVSHKHEPILDSTPYAEYVAQFHANKKALVIRNLLSEFGGALAELVKRPTLLLGDNDPATKLAKEMKATSKSKHWLLKYHLCRQNMSQGITLPLRVPTKDNDSDCGTKCQSAPDFTKLRKRLTGYAKSYTPPEWEPLPLPAWTPITELPNTIDDG